MRLSKMIGAMLMSTMLYAAPAGAQPVDDQLRATARALADEGMSFFEKKQYADALDRFDRAAAIIQAPTITLHAARSLDKLGRLIEASERYRTCINTPLDDKAPDAFRSAQDAARTELQTLTPRIPSIEIAVQGPGADQAVVTLDGKPVPKALIGVKTLVNPGEHKVGATTESHADLEEVLITEKQTARVVLDLEPKGQASDEHSTTPPKDTTVKTPMNPKKLGGFVAIGVGGALGITGAILGGVAYSDKEALEKRCTSGGKYPAGDYCLSSGFTSQVDAFQKERNASIAMLAIGSAALVTGVVLVVLASKDKPPADKPPTTSLHVQPWIGLGSAGFSGTF